MPDAIGKAMGALGFETLGESGGRIAFSGGIVAEKGNDGWMVSRNGGNPVPFAAFAESLGERAVNAANRMDPEAMWNRFGFETEGGGTNEIRVLRDGHCIYRSTWRPAHGKWLSGMRDPGNRMAPGVGDNVSVHAWLAKTLEGRRLTRARAAAEFLSLGGGDAKKPGEGAGERPLHLPKATAEAVVHCRAYLEGRGISEGTAKLAEEAGVLAYSPPWRGHQAALLFTGFWPDGSLALVAKRVAGEPMPQDRFKASDFSGSSKRRPPVFRGSGDVFACEGGVNMLSVLEMHAMLDLAMPTVIMTDGQGNRMWLDEPDYAEILRNAGRLFFLVENDPPESDAAGAKKAMMAAMEAVSGKRVEAFGVPLPFNDLNDALAANPDLVREIAGERLAAGPKERKIGRPC